MNILSKVICCLLFFPLTVSAADSTENDVDGLELVEMSDTGHIYSDPDANWGDYKRINLETISVAFRKNWQRDQNRYNRRKVRDDDIERIKSDLAELFDEVFTQELTQNGGYEIVQETGNDVLMIIPAIIELDVAAPETPQSRSSMTRNPGKMTLVLELVDSVSGDLLEQAKDKKPMHDRYGLQVSNRVTNRADAQMLLTDWARALRQRLDEVRSGTTG